jgi:hypothetical protein
VEVVGFVVGCTKAVSFALGSTKNIQYLGVAEVRENKESLPS